MKQRKTLGLRLPVWFTGFLAACAYTFTALVATAAPQAQSALLEAEEAFRVSARWQNDASVEVRFVIADGYYMYRDRFAFAADGEAIKLHKSRLPKGKLKRDPSFGNVITYRNSVRLLLPIKASDNAIGRNDAVDIDLTSQGCADMGVCYPPLRQTIRLARGANTVAEPAEAVAGSFSRQKSKQESIGAIADLLKKRD